MPEETMICPKCGLEYRKGFVVCSYCQVPLVEKSKYIIIPRQKTNSKPIRLSEYNEYAISSRVFGIIGLLGILGQIIGMNEMMRFLSNRDYSHPIITADLILTAVGMSSALLGIVFSWKGLKSEKVVIARAGRRISVLALILCLIGFLVALIGSFIVYPIEL